MGTRRFYVVAFLAEVESRAPFQDVFLFLVFAAWQGTFDCGLGRFSVFDFLEQLRS